MSLLSLSHYGGSTALSSSSLEQRPGSRNSVPLVQFSLRPHLASLAFVSGCTRAGVLHCCTQAPPGACICSVYSCQTPGGCKGRMSATEREWAKEGASMCFGGWRVEVRGGRELCLAWVILSGAEGRNRHFFKLTNQCPNPLWASAGSSP